MACGTRHTPTCGDAIPSVTAIWFWETGATLCSADVEKMLLKRLLMSVPENTQNYFFSPSITKWIRISQSRNVNFYSQVMRMPSENQHAICAPFYKVPKIQRFCIFTTKGAESTAFLVFSCVAFLLAFLLRDLSSLKHLRVAVDSPKHLRITGYNGPIRRPNQQSMFRQLPFGFQNAYFGMR